MSPSIRSRHADEFAELLDSGGRTDDHVVGPFLMLAESLAAVPGVPGPRPEFRAALRQRLVAVAAVQGVGEPAAGVTRLRESAATWRFQRRMAVLAGGAAAATAIAGVGLGASRSLPGDPFYGVKRASEDVQLATTFGQEAKGRRHLEFARTRLAEVEELAGQTSSAPAGVPGKPTAAGPVPTQDLASTIVSTLRDMDAETRAGAADLLAVHARTGDRDVLEALDEFSQDQYADLRGVLPALPADARARAAGSLALIAAVAQETVAAAGSTPAEQPGPRPSPSSDTPKPTKTAAPEQTESAGPTPTGTGSASPAPSKSAGGLLPGVPTTVPTIPPILPETSLSPVLPTELPTLPDLPLLGH